MSCQALLVVAVTLNSHHNVEVHVNGHLHAVMDCPVLLGAVQYTLPCESSGAYTVDFNVYKQ